VSNEFAPDKGPTPYFLCDNIHETLEDFKKKGIKVTEPKREGESPWFADFFDNVGNRWGVEEL
jgi:predicted enzyme related to lactoylglutathione lyase